MAKDKIVYVCKECGQESPKWIGRCPSCGQWNTYIEQVVRKDSASIRFLPGGLDTELDNNKPRNLREIETNAVPRIDMKDAELNRVLGGGLVPGSLVLLGGEPGIGKSTLILQTVMNLWHLKVLYVSGEESAQQLKLRADRLQTKGQSQETDEHQECLIVWRRFSPMSRTRSHNCW